LCERCSVGWEHAKERYGYGESNERGKMLLEFDTLTHDMNDKQYKILVRSYEKMDTDGIGWTTHKQTCTKVLIEKKTVVKNF